MLDVADIGYLEGQIAQDERSVWVLVGINSIGIIDFHGVYFKWVDGRHCLLPTVLFERNCVGHLVAQLLQVDVNLRLVQHYVGDKPPRKDFTPGDSGFENRDKDDRGIWVRLL